MRSSYQKLTMMTCLLVSSLCFNVFAQDATENQSLSPETEMAIMKVMNLENRIQTLQTVPVKMTDNELAGHFSGTWICFTTMRLNGQLGRGIMEIRLEQDGDELVGEGGQLKTPFRSARDHSPHWHKIGSGERFHRPVQEGTKRTTQHGRN